MSFREIVERYQALAGGFGKAVPLAAFGVSAEQTEQIFNAMDEDYHISRFLKFSTTVGEHYCISGDRVTHVSIDEGILALL